MQKAIGAAPAPKQQASAAPATPIAPASPPASARPRDMSLLSPSALAAKEASLGNPNGSLTASERNAVNDVVKKCWNPPVGAKDAKGLVVTLYLEMSPDGVPGLIQLVDDGIMQKPGGRQAAEAAYRALKNPACGKLPLPAAKYEGANGWNTIVYRFDPSELVP